MVRLMAKPSIKTLSINIGGLGPQDAYLCFDKVYLKWQSRVYRLDWKTLKFELEKILWSKYENQK